MNISVAMATYNGERFLAEQLASIRGQTLLPRELVVSDDGSSDATLEILTDFSQDAPFSVTILRNEKRLGFADNFLNAAEACQQPLIAFADQDDAWLPGKLREGARRLHCDDSLLSMHTLTVADKALRPTGFQWNQGIEDDTTYAPLQLDPFGTGWGNTMMFRREVINLIARELRPLQPGDPDRLLSHDTWVYVLSAALGRVSHISAPLLLYRQHGSNASGSTQERRRNKLLSLARVPIIEYREHAVFDAAMAKLFSDLSERGDSFAMPAKDAAERFTHRSAYWSSRVGTFENPTVSSRLEAYRQSRALSCDAPLWLGSRVKDLVLGVLGIGSSRIGAPLLRQPLLCGK